MSRSRTPPHRRTGNVTTLNEVAAHAKVSPMTVSRVVRGRGKVRESTRRRVLSAIQELHYVPNAAASALAAARHLRIALIYANPSSAYLGELLVGALRGVAQHAIQLTIDTWPRLDAAAMRAAAKTIGANASGVILPPPLCESTVLVEGLCAQHIPAVAVASGYFNNLISSVRIDDFVASRDITDYVIRAGHRRIAYIKGHRQQASSARRFEGFRAALAAAGITPDPTLEAQGDFTYRSGLAATEQLLSLRDPPTAICAGNDDMAAAVISAAHRRGLQVPDDLSVVGFDDTPIATNVWPELTTVHQPIAIMAASAVEILLQASSADADGTRVVVDRVMAHHLVERGSVAPPPKAA